MVREAIVTVSLSAAPEREVVIPLTATATGGATAQGESGEDYTGIPSSLTFGANETQVHGHGAPTASTTTVRE